MKKLLAALFVLCLMASPLASLAAASDGQGSPLDVFSVGMSKADAAKKGAVKTDNPDALFATLSQDGTDWRTILNFKNDKTVSIGLSTDVKNPLVAQLLEDMESRGYLPIGIERGKSVNVYKSPSKDAFGILNEELNAYAGQDTGEITVLFGSGPLFETLAKATSDEEEDAALTRYNDAVAYAMHIGKDDDKLTVVIATVGTLGQ